MIWILHSERVWSLLDVMESTMVLKGNFYWPGQWSWKDHLCICKWCNILQDLMVLKGIGPGVLKGIETEPFGNNFWTVWGRGLKFCQIVCLWAGHLVSKCQVTATITFGVIGVFVFQNYWSKFAHVQCQWSLWASWIDFGSKFWNLMGDATFGGKPANGIQKC